MSKYWVGDLEADSLNPTVVWVACFQNAATGEWFTSRDYNEIRRWFDANRSAVIVIHNGIGYDFRVLARLLGIRVALDRVVDTLVLSYLYHPSMPGGHSLEAWGDRLGIPKIGHDDWSRYTPAMLERCRRDVEINRAVFLALTKRMKEKGFSEQSCEIEHHFADIIRDQRENGFYFAVPEAQGLFAELRRLEGEAASSIHRVFPPELVPVKRYRRRTRKDGSDYSSYLKHLVEYPKVQEYQTETGPEYEVWDYREFNIGSPQQRIERLTGLGWQPEKFNAPTDKMRSEGRTQGSPKTDEESIQAFVEQLIESGDARSEQVHAIADWLYLNGRANMVGGWLAAVSEDSCIHGEVFSCGAGSRRCTHSKPNTANIPSNEAKYGHECRSLWRPRPVPGRVLLGYDAKSAQMRLFGHYLGNPAVTDFYTGVSDKGEPHAYNAQTIGIPRRPAKNCFYALIFGAKDPKLGLTAGGDSRLGSKVRKGLYENTPGLEDAIDRAQGMYDQYHGWLPCLDGGWVRCPRKTAALNYLIQPAEAVLMKLTAIKLRQRALEAGVEHLKVGDIHDEAQHDVASQAAAEALGQLAVEVMPQAGEELGITVRMEADYKTGTSWADTH